MEFPENEAVSSKTTPPRSRGRPRDWHDKSDQNTIKSLDRAIQILEHLSKAQDGMQLSQIAQEMKQSPATLYRVLVTFEGRGLVEFDPDRQVWNVGPKAFVIGARYLRRTSLVERARPVLRKLKEQTGETANLGIEKSGQVLFLSQIETYQNIRAFFPPGTLSPMHASGIGKALLAQMDEAQFNRWSRHNILKPFTRFTIAEKGQLKDELARIKRNGFALDNEEKNIGMRCIAAPVFDMNGEAVAAISVSGPTSRIDQEAIEALSSAVIAAAKTLTQALGGD